MIEQRNITVSCYIFIVLTLIISITSLAVTEKVAHALLESQSDMETLALLQQIFTVRIIIPSMIEWRFIFIYDHSRNEIGYCILWLGQGFRVRYYCSYRA